MSANANPASSPPDSDPPDSSPQSSIVYVRHAAKTPPVLHRLPFRHTVHVTTLPMLDARVNVNENEYENDSGDGDGDDENEALDDPDLEDVDLDLEAGEAGEDGSPVVPVAMTASPPSQWSLEMIEYVYRFCAFAALCANMNERASLFYHSVNWAAVVVVGVLTVVVGSKGVLTIGGHTTLSQSVTIVLTLCDILLAITASMMAGMSWRAKAVSYQRRSEEYSSLAVQIRVDMDAVHTLPSPKTYMQAIMGRIKALERMADPLPLRYRRDHDIRQGIISAWGTLDLGRRVQRARSVLSSGNGGRHDRHPDPAEARPKPRPAPTHNQNPPRPPRPSPRSFSLDHDLPRKRGGGGGGGRGGGGRTRSTASHPDMGQTIEGCVGEFRAMISQ